MISGDEKGAQVELLRHKHAGLKEIVASLDLELNEAYLWHGTQVRTGLQIAQAHPTIAFAAGPGEVLMVTIYVFPSLLKTILHMGSLS